MTTTTACCYRVFVDTGELWDCLLVVGRERGRCALYASADRLSRRASVELRATLRRLDDGGVARPSAAAPVVDANRLERVIKTLDVSDAFRRAVVERRDPDDRVLTASLDDDGGGGGVVPVCVRDVVLATPAKYRLPYTWCELYEKTDVEYRELENTMAWLSTLGGAFSSLGDQTEHCAIVAGKISVQQLKIAMRIGDPLTAVRCKLYTAISLMQRGFYKQAKSIVQNQYIFIKSQLIVDERLIKMCYGIWTKLRYERSRKKILNSNHTL